jgi:putative dimethyl sulfoxide reductase chaperone
VTELAGPSLAEARMGTYRLLARLVLAEIDAELLESLRDMPIFGEALAASGGAEALPALRVEYTRAFLMNAHPYESVYLDESGLLNTPQSGSVSEHYREQGFEPEAAGRTAAPDHLGLEFGFMAHLIEGELAARKVQNPFVAGSLKADQLHFLEQHLLRWGPILGRALAELAESPFYRTLGEAIETFLLGDYEALVAT